MSSPTQRTLAEETYYARNKARIRERLRLARLADPEKYRKRCREYYRKKRAIVLAAKKRHRQKNRNYYIAKAKQRRANKPGEARAYHLLKKFGISLAEYQRMLEKQGRVCAICRKSEIGRNLAVDHCHESGVVRGLLCSACNTSLGRFGEDFELLERAALYLRKFANGK